MTHIDPGGLLAVVDMGGVQKQVNLSLLEQVEVGDYVIVHVGYALTLLDQAEAEQTLALFAQMQAAEAP